MQQVCSLQQSIPFHCFRLIAPFPISFKHCLTHSFATTCTRMCGLFSQSLDLILRAHRAIINPEEEEGTTQFRRVQRFPEPARSMSARYSRFRKLLSVVRSKKASNRLIRRSYGNDFARAAGERSRQQLRERRSMSASSSSRARRDYDRRRDGRPRSRSSGPLDNDQSDRSDIRRKLDDMEKAKSRLEKQLRSAETEIESLQKEIELYRKSISNITRSGNHMADDVIRNPIRRSLLSHSSMGYQAQAIHEARYDPILISSPIPLVHRLDCQTRRGSIIDLCLYCNSLKIHHDTL